MLVPVPDSPLATDLAHSAHRWHIEHVSLFIAHPASLPPPTTTPRSNEPANASNKRQTDHRWHRQLETYGPDQLFIDPDTVSALDLLVYVTFTAPDGADQLFDCLVPVIHRSTHHLNTHRPTGNLESDLRASGSSASLRVPAGWRILGSTAAVSSAPRSRLATGSKSAWAVGTRVRADVTTDAANGSVVLEL
ncbi:hypothetical protein B0H13DRAFT_2654288 [Mycena leptocephala]|nr:hypothetical protein B0H13DRAFT_2654288 [Mycena leptocephala]